MEKINRKKTVKCYFKYFFIFACIIFCMLFVSCDFSTETDKKKNYNSTPIPTREPVATLEPDFDDPKVGGTLTIGATYAEEMNPLFTDSEEIKYAMTLVYDSFVKITNEGEIEPSVAQTWEVTEGKYHFTIRNDIKFSDGSSLTTAEIIDTLNYIFAQGGIYSNIFENVDKYYADGDYDIYFELLNEDSYFLTKMGFPIIKEIENEEKEKTLLGSGAYYFSQKGEDFIEYTRNDEYWGEKTFYQNVKICFFETEKEKYNSDCDVLFLKGKNITAYSASVGSTTYTYTGRSYICLIPNTKEAFTEYSYYTGLPLYKETNIAGTAMGRQALYYCIDMEKIIDTVQAGNATTMFLPLFGEATDQNENSGDYKKNLEKAFELFKELGYYYQEEEKKWYYNEEMTHPVQIDFYTLRDNAEYSAIINCLRDDFEAAGLTVQSFYVSKKSVVAYMYDRAYTFMLMSFETGDVSDLEKILGTGGEYNFNYYSNSTLDAYFKGLKVAKSEEEKNNLINEIIAICKEELPILGLYAQNEAVRFSSNVRGTEGIYSARNPLEYYYLLNAVKINE